VAEARANDGFDFNLRICQRGFTMGNIKRKFLPFIAVCLFLSFSLAQADENLPAPQKDGGIGLFSALKMRASAPSGDFPDGDVSREELSTILWAASGLNRGVSGWTVPMSRGKEPYCRIYVADNKGVSLYDWRSHSLLALSSDNIKARLGGQSFVKNAPLVLILVSDGKILSEFKDDAVAWEFAQVLAGAMTQDIYLAAANYGLGARYIHSMKVEEIVKALNLPPTDKPICLMMLGK
jgi:nitroreductase